MFTSISPAEAPQIIGTHMIVRDNFDFVMDLEKSHGCYIVDAREHVKEKDGTLRALSLQERTLLDFYTQFAAWPVGYNHASLKDPTFLASLQRAAINKIANSDIVTVEKAGYVRTMSQVAVHDGLDYLFIISGGALAVENALKAAFDWKIRLNFQKGVMFPDHEYRVAHFKEAFHGRSGYTMTLTNTDPDKVRFFPKFTNWPRITNPKMKFPIERHIHEVEAAENQAFAELDAAYAENPATLAAVILESVQAEGGDNHFRPEFWQRLRKWTEDRDILLVCDEVQSGCGLTGKFWAYQNHGIVPDLISFGKKMQVCGVLANKAKFDRIPDHCFVMAGRLNSTWGADLVDMVRATRLLQIIDAEQLVKNAHVQGALLRQGLEDLQREFSDVIYNVRGLGLMCAFDFFDSALRSPFVSEMRKRQVLTLTCGTRSIRLRPLLDVQAEHIQTYLATAAQALHAIRRS